MCCCVCRRSKLFESINSHPTLFEVVTGQVKATTTSKPAVQATAGSKRKEGVMVRAGSRERLQTDQQRLCLLCSSVYHRQLCSSGLRLQQHRPLFACLLSSQHVCTAVAVTCAETNGVMVFVPLQPEAYQGTATASGSKTPSANTKQLTHHDVSQNLVSAMAEVSKGGSRGTIGFLQHCRGMWQPATGLGASHRACMVWRLCHRLSSSTLPARLALSAPIARSARGSRLLRMRDL